MTSTEHDESATPPARVGVGRMSAVVQDRYGPVPADVLRLGEVEIPTIAEDEVLVRVHAASVDRGTWHIMAGLPYPIRISGFGLRAPKYLNPGRSLAGTVHAVGTGVTGFQPGDEVFGIGDATFAEYAIARPGKLALKPVTVSFAEASAVTISGVTALQAVRDQGRVQPGQSVLVVGASGGVGSFAVQIAKAHGAQVTGVCSPGKVDLVTALGADRVLDYTRDDFADGTHQYDVILDIGGNRRLRDLRRALTPEGTLVIVGGETDGKWLGGLDRQIRATLLSVLVHQKLGTFINSENATDLAAVGRLLEAGTITAAIDHPYPLHDAAAAVGHLLDGHARGKVVITVPEPERG